MAMTKALTSGFCTGILLLLSASLAESQVSLDPSPGNNTLALHKPSQEVSTPSSPALNNYGERKLPPLESTTPSSTTTIINYSAKPSGLYKNKEEQYFESNHDTITNTSVPTAVIDHDKSRHEEVTRKHLIEKLMENSYVDEKKSEVVPEFNEKEEYPDIEDNEGFGNKEPTTPKSKEDGVISLLNDTNVNFNHPKKEINEDSTSTKNEKITQENATNVISKDADHDGKSKDPKSQVEIVKNITSSKIQKIEETSKKVDKVTTKDANKTTDEIPVIPESFDMKNTPAGKNNNTATTIELVEPRNERNSSAKGRTISFGGINEFTSNSEEKAIDKESPELGYTKELKPYPYLKSSTSNPLNVSKPVSTVEEISPLENTIGRSSESNKKVVITEPSVVIDNSIQQIKPTYYKRSGNSSRINVDPLDTSTTTASAVTTTEKSKETTLIQNVTTIGSTPSTKEIIPTTELPKVPTKMPETRATEANLVQNSTDKTPMESVTSFDIETSPGDSMLMVSPLNVTEETTKAPTTSVPTETTTIFSSSAGVTTVTEETLPTTTIDEVGTTTLISETTTSTNFHDGETESTTGRVEYEFVGLTETTAKNYEGSSESTTSASTSSTESIELSTLDNATREELTTTDFITEVTTLSDVETTDYMTDGTTLVIPEMTSETSGITENPTVTTISMNPVSGQGGGRPEETSTIGTSTEVASSSSEDSSSTVTNTESTIQVVTDVPWSNPEDVNVLVRIVVEGSWGDVCPHLQALRQALADLLTGGIEKIVSPLQIRFQKNPCAEELPQSAAPSDLSLSTLYLYIVDQNGNFDATMTRILPSLYTRNSIKSHLNIRSIQLVQDSDSGNAIAVVVVSCVAFICLVLLAGLLFIMRKRQTRFNYGERCRPVSLDAFSLDSVSAYNSVRRKGANRASKRSYGNPTFEDSTAIPSHPLNFAGLSAFCNEQSAIYEEYSNIPQVSAKIDELPPGAEVKNRYANVVPLPETRVPLAKINNDPLSEYINASYVRGPKNATKYYIACQAPMESTVTDFWRMIWEQQCKVIIMLTDLIENGVEKCAEYVPPSEVTDCHRLYGDYQVTLKKRETKEKYAISTLHLKNLENNTYREISHIWYLWPSTGVQSDAAGLIAVLLEARALQRGGPVPIVVHCSPGTGRTGTLIALDLGIRQYEITRTIDVPRVVYTIRRDRAGAVQTKEQYAFIYKALNLYATKLAGGGIEST